MSDEEMDGVLGWAIAEQRAILRENGVASGMACLSCRKIVQSDRLGLLFCACRSEQPRRNASFWLTNPRRCTTEGKK